MDPNPLLYQNADENQPLYRAALLSAGAVAFLIVGVLGLNFVLHHSGSGSSSSVNRTAETSPDDSVGGIRRELSGDPVSGLSGLGGPMGTGTPVSYPEMQNMVSGDNDFAASAGFSKMSAGTGSQPGVTPTAFERNDSTGYKSNQAPAGEINGTQVRDVGSVSPSNLAALLRGF